LETWDRVSGKGFEGSGTRGGLFDGDFDSKLRFCFALSARGSRIRIDGVPNKTWEMLFGKQSILEGR